MYRMNYIPASAVAAIAGRHRYVSQNEGISKNLETYCPLVWDELMTVATYDAVCAKNLDVITSQYTNVELDLSASSTENILRISENPDIQSLLESLPVIPEKPLCTSTEYMNMACALIKATPALQDLHNASVVGIRIDSTVLDKGVTDIVSQTNDIPSDIIKQAVISEISKHRGTKLEDSTMRSTGLVNALNSLYPMNKVTKPKTVYKRYFSTDPTSSVIGYECASDVPRDNDNNVYTISGCIDSMVSCADTGEPLCILEIKNRMKRFYTPEHDLIQLYVYILLCDVPRGHLVQQLSGNVRMSDVINRCDALTKWTSVKDDLDKAVLYSHRIKRNNMSMEALAFMKTCTFCV